MACFLLPSPQLLSLPNVTMVPRVLVGYLGQPTMAGSQMPQLSLSQPMGQSLGQTVLPMGPRATQPLTFTHSTHTTFTRPPLYKGPARGSKRRCSDSENTEDSPDSTSQHPLYCKICKVQLNAPCQAKQHYEGKTHAKRLKMYTDSSSEGSPPREGGDTPDKPSSTTNGNVVVQSSDEINPEIYCKHCGVSFNSPKQSEQHYKGKNHAKRVRGSRPKPHSRTYRDQGAALKSTLPKFYCTVCSLQLTSQDQLNKHVVGARHVVTLQQQQEKQVAAAASLTGRWGTTAQGSNLPFSSLGQVALRPLGLGVGLSGSAKRSRRDFSMYRTPSGNYYCSCCNVTMTTEPQFAQHVTSRKHKMTNSLQKNIEHLEM